MRHVMLSNRVGYAPRFLVGLGVRRPDPIWSRRGYVVETFGGEVVVEWDDGQREMIARRDLDLQPEPELAECDC